ARPHPPDPPPRPADLRRTIAMVDDVSDAGQGPPAVPDRGPRRGRALPPSPPARPVRATSPPVHYGSRPAMTHALHRRDAAPVWGLRASDFRPIAPRGFGDPRNSYPHSMAWFRDRLYVGTTRNILHLVKIAPDPSTDEFHLWPVHVPQGTDAASLDQRC